MPPPPSYHQVDNAAGHSVHVIDSNQQAPFNQPTTVGNFLNNQHGQTFRIVVMPGVEFDPSRKHRYGCHALVAGILLFLSFVLVELRDCNWSPGIDLDRLQVLHFSLMVFALVLYVLSLFSIADLLSNCRPVFFVGILFFYAVAVLMVWMTYEAAVNPCVKTFTSVPIDFLPDGNNVFTRGDKIGVIVLIFDAVAAVLMFSSATHFVARN